ncbi:MAG: hypothetical protein K0S45_3067, partial [Nitrospira sp.]|nr:hypothetical protein [Nitrospira sp.]
MDGANKGSEADGDACVGKLLSLNLQRGTESQPLGGPECGHVREVGDVPEHDVLFLNTLIVLVIAELTACSKQPWDILIGVGAANSDIMVGEPVSLSVAFEGRIAVPWKNPDAMACQLVSHEPGPSSGRAFVVIALIPILFPSWAPAL